MKDWLTACAGKCEFDFVPVHFYGTEVDQLIDYVKVSPLVPIRYKADLIGIQCSIQQTSLVHRGMYPQSMTDPADCIVVLPRLQYRRYL